MPSIFRDAEGRQRSEERHNAFDSPRTNPSTATAASILQSSANQPVAHGVGGHMPAVPKKLPASMLSVRTRPLFVLHMDVQPYQVIGGTPGAFRRVGVVPGGNFEGERLSGKVLPGGNDWQTVRADGSTLLEVRLVLETSDGATIGMTYKGIRHGPAEVIERVNRGEDIDPSGYYFRTNPVFETAAPALGWLNAIISVGIGYRTPSAVIYSLFEIL